MRVRDFDFGQGEGTFIQTDAELIQQPLQLAPRAAIAHATRPAITAPRSIRGVAALMRSRLPLPGTRAPRGIAALKPMIQRVISSAPSAPIFAPAPVSASPIPSPASVPAAADAAEAALIGGAGGGEGGMDAAGAPGAPGAPAGTAGSLAAPAAGAVGGFLVAGPIGAVAGAAAGWFLGRKK